MTTGWTRAAVAFATAGALLCACGQRSDEQSSSSAPPRHSTVNPSTFPLYQPSEIVDVVPIDLGPMAATMRKNDRTSDTPPSYTGHEIIAGTNASLDQLRSWVRKLKASPPRGLRVNHGVNPSSTRADMFDSAGAIEADFETTNQDRHVTIIAVDPKRFREKFAPALDAADNYKSVPGVMRSAIDDIVRKKVGYSLSEMLDPRSPFGVIIATVKTMQSRDQRAIILIDGSSRS